MYGALRLFFFFLARCLEVGGCDKLRIIYIAGISKLENGSITSFDW